jgi:spermidine/putrescine-binding protein
VSIRRGVFRNLAFTAVLIPSLLLLALAFRVAQGAGSIFDDSNSTAAPDGDGTGSAASGAGQSPTYSMGTSGQVDMEGLPADAPDVIAQTKHDTALAKAIEAYREALVAADKQLLVDLNAAMDSAMARRSVPDVKRIDSEITLAQNRLNASAALVNAASSPAAVAPAGGSHTVIFVCSGSGSMITKIAQAKIEISRAIDLLEPTQSFNVVFHKDGEVSKLAVFAIPANPANKRKATTWVQDVATAGVTDPIPALGFALHSRPETIYFFADGANLPKAVPIENVLRESDADRKTKIKVILMVDNEREQRGCDEAEQLKQWISDNGFGSATWLSVDQAN